MPYSIIVFFCKLLILLLRVLFKYRLIFTTAFHGLGAVDKYIPDTLILGFVLITEDVRMQSTQMAIQPDAWQAGNDVGRTGQERRLHTCSVGAMWARCGRGGCDGGSWLIAGSCHMKACKMTALALALGCSCFWVGMLVAFALGGIRLLGYILFHRCRNFFIA